MCRCGGTAGQKVLRSSELGTREARKRGQGGRGPLLVVEGRKGVLTLTRMSDGDLC